MEIRARDALQTLEARLAPLDDLDGASAFEAMVAFHREVRVLGVDLVADGDMLLCQWGVFDWGQGPSFEFDITRQLGVGGTEDDQLFQLSLTLRYRPDDMAGSIDRGHLWCPHPDRLEPWRRSIMSEPAYRFASQRRPDHFELDFELVG